MREIALGILSVCLSAYSQVVRPAKSMGKRGFRPSVDLKPRKMLLQKNGYFDYVVRYNTHANFFMGIGRGMSAPQIPEI